MRSITTRFAGLTILIGGLWGALIPFVGPYFHYGLGPDRTWTWTTGRLYLDVLPGIAAIIGGVLLMAAGPWPTGRLGALIALVAGIWFVVGPDLSYIWQAGGAQGVAHGSRTVRVLEAVGYHTGLGVLIAALAAYALPGFLRAPAPVAATEGAAAGAAEACSVGCSVAGGGRSAEPTDPYSRCGPARRSPGCCAGPRPRHIVLTPGEQILARHAQRPRHR